MRNIVAFSPHRLQPVAITVGLICDRVMSAAAIDYLLWKSGEGVERECTLEYRSKGLRGYPGDVKILSEGKASRYLPNTERTKIKDFFTPTRCRLCFDKMNALADIVVGDPHGIQDFDSRNGESVVIARTLAGVAWLERAGKDGVVQLRAASYENVLRGQGITARRRDWQAYVELWTQRGRRIPPYFQRLASSTEDAFDIKTRHRRGLRNSLRLARIRSRKALLWEVRLRLFGQMLAQKVRSGLKSWRR